MDPKLYQAASEGLTESWEELLRSGPANHTRPGATVIGVENQTHEHKTGNLLLGVTHAENTALHIAAWSGDYEVAKKICGQNGSVDAWQRQGRNSLTLCSYNWSSFLSKKLPVLPRPSSRFHLQLPTSWQCCPTTRGVFAPNLVRKRNPDGETALYQAIHHRQVSPLYLVAMQDSPFIVTSLVQKSKESNSQAAFAGPDGQTALLAASVRNAGNKMEVIKLELISFKPHKTCLKLK